MKTILLIDDDGSFREVMSETLSDFGFASRQASSVQEAVHMLAPLRFHAIFIDYKMPGLNGIEGLPLLREKAPDTPIIMMTSFADANKTLEAISGGAFDYLTKPVTRDQIRKVLDQLPERELHSLAHESAPEGAFISESAVMREVVKRVARVAKSDLSILIQGETGTGKELIAQLIHDFSLRKGGPFVALNCAAIPEDLLESELFGHVKGSFTGAVNDREGAFARARGGTLFLDEIGDLDLSLQAKLLRVLQEREVTPVGSSKTIHVDTRFVSATHQDLNERVRAGQFRQDLYYRLNAAEISLPPLRDRGNDIRLLASAFLLAFPGKRLDETALAKLESYEWPGNIRELKNVIESSALLTPGSLILEKDLNLRATNVPVTETLAAEPATQEVADLPLPAAVDRLEQQMLIDALKRAGQNRSEAAKILGIPRQALYVKLKQYGLMDR